MFEGLRGESDEYVHRHGMRADNEDVWHTYEDSA
jgi:hypothetical protein